MTCKNVEENPNKENCPVVTTDALAAPLDWTELPIFRFGDISSSNPFYNPEERKFYIVIQLPYQSAGGPNEREKRLEQAKEPAVTRLLNIFDKIISEENIINLINVAEIDTANGFNVPLRPNPECDPPVFGLKVLVGIPQSEFEKIPFDEESPLPVADDEIVIISNEFREQVVEVRKLLRKADQDATFADTGPNLDFGRESQNLQTFVSVFEKFLIDNGFSIRDDAPDLLIIGLNDGQVRYILIDQGRDLIRLRCKIIDFVTNKFVTNQRVINILKNLNFLTKERNKVLPWSNLLNNIPNISLPRVTIDLPGSRLSSCIEVTEKKHNSKPVKTEEELQKENEELSVAFKTKVEQDNITLDTIGKKFEREFGYLNNINTLEDVFNLFLNRNDMRCLAADVIKCLFQDLPLDAVTDVLAREYLNNIVDYGDFLNLINELGLELTDFQSFNIPAREKLLKCWNNLEEKERQVITKQGIERTGTRIETPDDIRNNPNLKNVLDAFGFRGELVARETYEENKREIIDEMVEIVGAEGLAQTNIDSTSGLTLVDAAVTAVTDIDVCNFPPKIPKIPSFDFSDFFPTIDIMGSIFEQMALAILDALATALIGIVKTLIEELLKNCAEIRNFDFGASDIKDLIQDRLGLPDEFPENSQEWLDATKGIISALGLDADIFVEDGNLGQLGNAISGLFDDLSAVLTPGEIANLLDGSVTEDTRRIIDCLINKKYQPLKSAMQDPDKVFGNLGTLANKQALVDQLAAADDFGSFKNFCDTTDEEVRERLLGGKMTPAEIQDEIDKTRRAKLNRVAELANIIEDENAFNKLMPPMLCQISEDGSVIPGLVPFNPPSFRFMMDKTVDTIYDGVRMTFDQEISTFNNLVEEKQNRIPIPRVFPKKKDIKFTDSEGDDKEEDVLNPEYTRAISQGYVGMEGDDVDKEPFNPDEKGDAQVLVWEDEILKSSQKKTFVATGLKSNLENIESDLENFKIVNLDDGTAKIDITIPNDLRVNTFGNQDAIDKLRLFAERQKSFFEGTLKEDILNIAAETSASVDKHFITYEFSRPEGGQNTDTFTLNIKSGPTTSSLTSNIDNSIENVVDPETLRFLNEDLKIDTTQSNQQNMFGQFLTNAWKKGPVFIKDGERVLNKPRTANGIIGNSQELTNIVNNELRETYTKSRYFELFRDTFSYAGKQVAKSQLFDSRVMNLVDFLQVPLDDDGNVVRKKGCKDPHLLDLDEIKKRMKDKFFESECNAPQFPSTDGLGSPDLNPLEGAGIDGAVLTFVRLYCIDLILKSIFAFSELRITNSEQLDELVINYFREQIKNDISRLFRNENVFKKEFEKQVPIVFNNLIDDNFPGFENLNKIENLESTSAYNDALDGLINKELKSVINDISQILKPKESISPLSITDSLILNQIPLFDIPANGEDKFSRFFRQLENLSVNNVLQDFRDASETGGFSFAKYANEVGESAKFLKFLNEQKGSFFVEGEGQEEELVNFIKNQFKNVTSSENLLNLASVSRRDTGPTSFNIENGNFIFERYVRVVDKENQPSDIKNREYHLKGVVNIVDWNNYVSGIRYANITGRTEAPVDSISTWFDISYGIRLVYIPPPKLKKTTNQGFEQELSSTPVEEKIFNRGYDKDVEKFEKTFIFKDEKDEKIEFDVKSGNSRKKVSLQRTMYPVPLISVEVDATNIEDRYFKDEIDDPIFQRFNSKKDKLIQDLKDSGEFKFLFNYCFPLDRLMSLVIIYCNVYLSVLPELRTMFDGTKQSLKRVFMSLLNGGNYQYEDDFAFEKLGGNKGMMSEANNAPNTEPSIDGISLPPIAARTPLLILKGLVELIDPNIKIARKIVDTAKENGKDVPMLAASLGQLPSNVFPPPTIGPGIGPAITPLGFVYLALDIDGAMADAKAINVRRDSINTELDIDMDFNGRAKASQECEDTEEES